MEFIVNVDLYELFEKVKFINKGKDYKYGFTCDLDIWRKYCNYFFNSAKLIDYDFIKSRSIYSHNFSILYLLARYLIDSG